MTASRSGGWALIGVGVVMVCGFVPYGFAVARAAAGSWSIDPVGYGVVAGLTVVAWALVAAASAGSGMLLLRHGGRR